MWDIILKIPEWNKDTKWNEDTEWNEDIEWNEDTEWKQKSSNWIQGGKINQTFDVTKLSWPYPKLYVTLQIVFSLQHAKLSHYK